MSENYRRIIKGYKPREPTTVFEKLFYVLWCMLCALRILAISIKRKTLERG